MFFQENLPNKPWLLQPILSTFPLFNPKKNKSCATFTFTYTPPVFMGRPKRKFQPSIFRGELLNFGRVPKLMPYLKRNTFSRRHHFLVGGFNPSEKYYGSQNGNLPQIGGGENKKYLKPPSSFQGISSLKKFRG